MIYIQRFFIPLELVFISIVFLSIGGCQTVDARTPEEVYTIINAGGQTRNSLMTALEKDKEQFNEKEWLILETANRQAAFLAITILSELSEIQTPSLAAVETWRDRAFIVNQTAQSVMTNAKLQTLSVDSHVIWTGYQRQLKVLDTAAISYIKDPNSITRNQLIAYGLNAFLKLAPILL
jgi:hypothetical protein